jgi:signal peptidase II
MTDDARPVHRLRIVLLVAAGVVLVDQLTKHWALRALSDGDPIHVIWTLQWNLAYNTGMAFSKGQGMGPIIGILALAVAGMIVWSMRRQSSVVASVAAGLVLGGALGNLADRLFRGDAWLQGAVVDFIDLQWFPIFNVADIAVNLGGILFVLWALFGQHEGAPA